MGLVLLVFGVVLITIGAALLAGGHHAAKNQDWLEKRCTATTEAKLIDTVHRVSEFNDEDGITYHGVYEYVAEDGLIVQVQNKNGYGMPDSVPGPIVTIRYNPDSVSEFLLPEEQVSVAEAGPALKKAGIISLVLGFPLTIAGVVLFGA